MSNPRSLSRPARRRDELGATLVLVTVFVVALFGMAALAIDVGNMYTQRNRIQDGIDSAALAAVSSWAGGKTPDEVVTTAQAFAMTNGVQSSDIQSIEAGEWIRATRTFTALSSLPVSMPAGTLPAVRVIARKTIAMYFASVVGMKAMSPRLEASAVAGHSVAAARVMPFAMCFDEPTKIPCTTVTLKFANGGISGSETTTCQDGAGNSQFGGLDLPVPGGGGGADNYGENILYGYPGVLRVGEWVSVKTGNMSGPTFKNLDDRVAGLPPYTCTASPPSGPPNDRRLTIVPAFDNLDLSGKKPLQIKAFYVVVLNDIDKKDGIVTAQFLSSYQGTEVDPDLPPMMGRLTAIGLVK